MIIGLSLAMRGGHMRMCFLILKNLKIVIEAMMDFIARPAP